jgi:hypothetical protein
MTWLEVRWKSDDEARKVTGFVWWESGKRDSKWEWIRRIETEWNPRETGTEWEWIRRIEAEWNPRETGTEWDRMKVAGNGLEPAGDWKGLKPERELASLVGRRLAPLWQ